MTTKTQSVVLLQAHEIEEIVMAFNTKELPLQSWTHTAHQVVAFWYLKHYSREDTIQLLKHMISSYNERVGIPNTDVSGYHETLTIFWILVIEQFMVAHQLPFVQCVNRFIDSPMADKNYPMTFYSRDHLFSLTARRYWILPDLKELNFDI